MPKNSQPPTFSLFIRMSIPMIYQKQHLLSRHILLTIIMLQTSASYSEACSSPSPPCVFSHGLLSQASLAKIKINWLIHSQFHFPVNSTWEIHASSAVCVSRTLVVDKNRILCQDKTYHCNVRCNSSFDSEQMMLAALMLSRKSIFVVPCRVCIQMHSVILERYS